MNLFVYYNISQLGKLQVSKNFLPEKLYKFIIASQPELGIYLSLANLSPVVRIELFL